MEIYYRSSGVYNYIDIPLGTEWDVWERGDYYKIRMITENKIKGIINPVQLGLDGKIFLRYEVTGCVSLAQVFENIKPQGTFLKSLLALLEEVEKCLNAHLLSGEDMVISEEYILYDMEKRCIYFLYVPGYGINTGFQIKGLLEYIMRKFDHRDTEGVDFLYKTYEYFVGRGSRRMALGTYKNECSGGLSFFSGDEMIKEEYMAEIACDNEKTSEKSLSCRELPDHNRDNTKWIFRKKAERAAICVAIVILSVLLVIIIRIT